MDQQRILDVELSSVASETENLSRLRSLLEKQRRKNEKFTTDIDEVEDIPFSSSSRGRLQFFGQKRKINGVSCYNFILIF